MGSGNGRTETQKLKRFDLEDFKPDRGADEKSGADSPSAPEEPAQGEALAAETTASHPGLLQTDPAVRGEPEAPKAHKRSPADAYGPLHDFLENFDSDIVMISFAAIENMIKRKLPPSARERETWWTNRPRGRGHAKAWLDLGWQVDRVDLRKGRVTFTRLG